MTDIEPTTSGADNSARRLWRWIAGLAALAVLIGALVYFFRPTVVPELELKSGEQTEALLQAAGLRLGNVAQVATSSVGEGLIIQQSPAGGTTVRRRSSVDVTQAVAAKPVPIPDVAGLDLDAATQKLEEAQDRKSTRLNSSHRL